MKSLSKLLGLVFIGLLLIIVALGFALTHLFDPNDYKDEIRQLARDKVNLELTINGDIGWSLFPWLGLELSNTTLASAASPDQPFADVRLLGLSVRVLPLLRKEVQMSDIRVDGLNLTLQRDAQGHGNWQDIGHPAKPAATTSTSPADSASAPAADKPAPAAQPLRLDIDSLSLSNSRIDYRDAQTGQQYTADNIQLRTGAIREGASIPLQFSALLSSNQPVVQARTELQGQLRFDRALKRYQFEDLKLSGEASGEPLQGKTLTFTSQGQLLLDQAAQVAEWNNLKLSLNQLRALGELKVHSLDSTPALEGGLSIAPLNLREFLEGIGQTLPAMSDATALSKFELLSRLKGSRSSLGLEDLTLKLDDSTYTGSLGVSDFASQALRIQLKGDRLNLDRYLPPAASTTSARQAEVKTVLAAAGEAGTSELPKAPTQQAWSETSALPIERLRSLDAQLGLSFGQLTVHQLPLEDVNLKANAKDGLLSLSELRGELFNGDITGTASLDVRPVSPLLGLQPHISRVAADKLLHALGQKPSVSGALELNADLQSSGNSQKAWIDNLKGTTSFALNDGVLFNANLEQQLCQGIATLNRKSLSGEARGKDTPFESLSGNLNILNGVASNPDLKARIQGLSVNGDGTLDLRVLGMDYHIGIIIEGDKSEMPDPACQVNPRYVGLQWPLLCRGPLELGAKACRLDREGLNKVASKLATEKLGEKIEEKLGDKVSPELKDALKGLFNR